METLALIWGRDESSISRYIDEFADEWGEAGEDLSILEVSEEFLEATYPQRYREAGLLRVCALPDGKDFMIHTPRSNTVLTRASHSDKVSYQYKILGFFNVFQIYCFHVYFRLETAPCDAFPGVPPQACLMNTPTSFLLASPRSVLLNFGAPVFASVLEDGECSLTGGSPEPHTTIPTLMPS